MALAACALALPGSEGWSGALSAGDALASQHRLLSAADRYQGAALWPGGSSPARVRLGRVYLKRGQASEAAEAFRRAEASGAGGREVEQGLASALSLAGDARASLAALRRELDLRPGDGETWTRLVEQAARAGLPPEDTAKLLGTVSPPAGSDPFAQKASYLLGASVLGAQSREGEDALRRAASGSDEQLVGMARELLSAAAPEDARTKAVSLAGALLAQGLVGPALAQLGGFEAGRPGDARGLALKGYALMRAGQLDGAEEALRSSQEMEPDWPLGQYFLGALLRLRGDAEGAARLLVKAAQAEPGNPAYYLELAGALAEVGDYGNAEQALRLAVDAAPDSPELRLVVVRFFVDRQYRVEGVLEDADQAVRMSGRSAESLGALGWALNLVGRPQGALAPLTEAVAKDPESPLLRYRLGSVYEGLKQPERAREQYLMVGELDGTGDYWKRARAALEGL